MEAQTLQTIAEWCGGRLVNADPKGVVRGVVTDSRAVKAGDLFVALSGEHFDGHDFLVDVCAKGAEAAVVHGDRLAALPPDMGYVAVGSTRGALGALGGKYRQLFDLTAVAI